MTHVNPQTTHVDPQMTCQSTNGTHKQPTNCTWRLTNDMSTHKWQVTHIWHMSTHKWHTNNQQMTLADPQMTNNGTHKWLTYGIHSNKWQNTDGWLLYIKITLLSIRIIKHQSYNRAWTNLALVLNIKSNESFQCLILHLMMVPMFNIKLNDGSNAQY